MWGGGLGLAGSNGPIQPLSQLLQRAVLCGGFGASHSRASRGGMQVLIILVLQWRVASLPIGSKRPFEKSGSMLSQKKLSGEVAECYVLRSKYCSTGWSWRVGAARRASSITGLGNFVAPICYFVFENSSAAPGQTVFNLIGINLDTA